MPDQPKISWRRRSAIVSIALLGIIIGWYSALYGVEQVASTIEVLQQGSVRGGRTELSFLRAALDRLAADAKQMDPASPALPSLRAERAAVIQRMREVERALGTEAVSGQLQLGAEASRPVNPNPVSTSNNRPDGVLAPRALKVGLALVSQAPEFDLSRDPALNQMVLIAGTSDSAASGGTTSEADPEPAAVQKNEHRQKSAVDTAATTGLRQERGPDPEEKLSANSPEPADGTKLPDISLAKRTGPVTVDNSPLVLRRPAQASTENASVADKDRNQGTRMDLAVLVARGDQLLGSRDVNAARSFYERAAALGSGLAALHMGMTFDPAFLSRLGLHAAYANPAQAGSWYRHAAELGEKEAAELQNRIEEQARVGTSKN
jgi:hypothetical protein